MSTAVGIAVVTAVGLRDGRRPPEPVPGTTGGSGLRRTRPAHVCAGWPPDGHRDPAIRRTTTRHTTTRLRAGRVSGGGAPPQTPRHPR
ncbi:hypothetical protein GCM10009660_12450 [Catellatospora bangladeshensis]